jgi:hypothetical protein
MREPGVVANSKYLALSYQHPLWLSLLAFFAWPGSNTTILALKKTPVPVTPLIRLPSFPQTPILQDAVPASNRKASFFK